MGAIRGDVGGVVSFDRLPGANADAVDRAMKAAGLFLYAISVMSFACTLMVDPNVFEDPIHPVNLMFDVIGMLFYIAGRVLRV